jgi:hypothetical protein
LLQVVQALGLFGFDLRFAQRRQKHSSQNCDDRNDHQSSIRVNPNEVRFELGLRTNLG